MIAGLPGTGLGGLFYMIASLVVIGRALVHGTRNGMTPAAWRGIARLAVMLSGILLAIWGTYWIIGEILAVNVPPPPVGIELPIDQTQTSLTLPSIFIATLPVQVATILLLLASVELLRWLIHRRTRYSTPPPVILLDHPAELSKPLIVRKDVAYRDTITSRRRRSAGGSELAEPQAVGHDKDA